MNAITARETMPRRAMLGGVEVDLMTQAQAVDRILTACAAPGVPLAVASANLEHITHFGRGARWAGALRDEAVGGGAGDAPAGPGLVPEWLVLLDGAPLAKEARARSGAEWPRLAGSDLIGPVLDEAERRGLRLGFLGGTEAAHDALRRRLDDERPGLRLSGLWSPPRSVVEDHAASEVLAQEVRAAGTDVLVVALGKPRQELWIHAHAVTTGASALLAFGAAVDFLAGTSSRAPHWVRERGLEWSWRLAHEPRRLAHRYLVMGPSALATLRDRHPLDAEAPAPAPAPGAGQPTGTAPDAGEPGAPASFAPGGAPLDSCFVGGQGRADVTVLVVTHQSAQHIGGLLEALRRQRGGLRLRVLVADMASTDRTVQLLRREEGITLFEVGANLGYAGGINLLRPHVGETEAVLVLNPDLRPSPDALLRLLHRQRRQGGGITVPRLLTDEGEVHRSLRREPSLTRAWGDALFGERVSSGTRWGETETDPEAYVHAHPVDWATGAAVMVDAGTHARLGPWDERYFLYSEETDYFRRAREAHVPIWFEPESTVRHSGAGSGQSFGLHALLAVNRVRYVRDHHGPGYAALFRAAVVTRHALRSFRPADRAALRAVASEASWSRLPARAGSAGPDTARPDGVVIIPAHNEAAVLPRLLDRLAPAAGLDDEGRGLEVIVACNGCTDATLEVARSYPSVRVLDVAEASKVAALNAADRATDRFPRIYLDADIEVTLASLAQTLDALREPGALAARPAFEYETAGARALVRAFYRARRRLPSTTTALWGAGAYGLSESGHARIGAFPNLTADDLFVDTRFAAHEKRILPVHPVRVRVPRTRSDLMGVLRRVYRGQSELTATAGHEAKPDTRRTLRELLASVTSPQTAADAAVYASFVLAARRPRRAPARAENGAAGGGRAPAWERDESSR